MTASSVNAKTPPNTEARGRQSQLCRRLIRHPALQVFEWDPPRPPDLDARNRPVHQEVVEGGTIDREQVSRSRWGQQQPPLGCRQVVQHRIRLPRCARARCASRSRATSVLTGTPKTTVESQIFMKRRCGVGWNRRPITHDLTDSQRKLLLIYRRQGACRATVGATGCLIAHASAFVRVHAMQPLFARWWESQRCSMSRMMKAGTAMMERSRAEERAGSFAQVNPAKQAGGELVCPRSPRRATLGSEFGE